MSGTILGRQIAVTQQRAEAPLRSAVFYQQSGGRAIPSHVAVQGEALKASDREVNLEASGMKPAGNLYFNHFIAGLVKQDSDVSYSSGSEHDNSLSLDLEDDFFNTEGKNLSEDKSKNSSSSDGSSIFYGDSASKMIESLAEPPSSLEKSILNIVLCALKAEESSAGAVNDAELGESSRSYLRRRVMTVLKFNGFKAAVCKSHWEHVKNSPGGAYEYIDVISGDSDKDRIVVDIHFKDQFVIARPSEEYLRLLTSVPSVYVGRSDALRQIVDMMTEAMKQSVRVIGLHLPPWRKPEYVQAKWFSAFKRTTNDVPSALYCPSNDIFSANYNSMPPVVDAEWVPAAVPAQNSGSSGKAKGQLSLAFEC